MDMDMVDSFPPPAQERSVSDTTTTGRNRSWLKSTTLCPSPPTPTTRVNQAGNVRRNIGGNGNPPASRPQLHSSTSLPAPPPPPQNLPPKLVKTATALTTPAPPKVARSISRRSLPWCKADSALTSTTRSEIPKKRSAGEEVVGMAVKQRKVSSCGMDSEASTLAPCAPNSAAAAATPTSSSSSRLAEVVLPYLSFSSSPPAPPAR